MNFIKCLKQVIINLKLFVLSEISLEAYKFNNLVLKLMIVHFLWIYAFILTMVVSILVQFTINFYRFLYFLMIFFHFFIFFQVFFKFFIFNIG